MFACRTHAACTRGSVCLTPLPRQIRFWGKIRGLQQDYFICQGTIDANGKMAPFDTKRVTFKRCVIVEVLERDARVLTHEATIVS